MRIVALYLVSCIMLSVNSFAGSKLDAVKSSTVLITELKDVYHGYKLFHIINDQYELISVTYGEDSAAGAVLAKEFLTANKAISTANITDRVLRAKADSLIFATANNYKVLLSKGQNSQVFEKSVTTLSGIIRRYVTYLSGHYATSHFVKMTEDEYWKTISKNSYIKASTFKDYQKTLETDFTKATGMLNDIIAATREPQERAIYMIEKADGHVKYDSLRTDGKEVAISTYKKVLDEKRYSLYLYETWLKWRAVSQQENGLSKMSDIPNATYDSVREDVALVMLQYIAANPKDEMAINQFLVIASHDIVRRFGKYPYGNQNTIEYHELFDEN